MATNKYSVTGGVLGHLENQLCVTDGRRKKKTQKKRNSFHLKQRKTFTPIKPELIEPRKIFITNLPKTVHHDLLKSTFERIGEIENITLIKNNNKITAKPYAFIKFANEEDTKKALNLQGNDLDLNGYQMVIKAAKILIKMPGFPDYIRSPLSDTDFDLEPLTQNVPSAHSLNDYVLLKIFNCIPFRDLVPLERVCRRWQSLVYSNFRTRTSKYIENDIDSWMLDNKLGQNLQEFTKILIYGGESILQIKIKFFSSEVESKLLRIIGQLCPNLKSISIGSSFSLKPFHFTELRALCPKLEKFIIQDQIISSVTQDIFSAIVFGLPELKVLRLAFTIVQIDNLTPLPKNLKELQLECCPPNKKELDVSGIFECPDLEVFELNRTSLSMATLNKIGRQCTKLQTIKVISDFTSDGNDSEEIDWSIFKNLKVLSCYTKQFNIQSILDEIPDLEHLIVRGPSLKESESFFDFSKLSNLKKFELSNTCLQKLDVLSLQTFYECRNLEEFRYFKKVDSNRFLLKMIQNCPKLKVLECPEATIGGEDIDDFVQANRGREFRLRFVIGLNQSALNQIEKLEAANYDIEMFDTFNLFNDDELFYGTDDDDEDYFDFEDYHLDYDSDGDSLPSSLYDEFENFLGMGQHLAAYELGINELLENLNPYF